jgi:hypothetical protein
VTTDEYLRQQEIVDRHILLAIIGLVGSLACWYKGEVWWAGFWYVIFNLSIWRVDVHRKILRDA